MTVYCYINIIFKSNLGLKKNCVVAFFNIILLQIKI